jgi:hypothetical protein
MQVHSHAIRYFACMGCSLIRGDLNDYMDGREAREM